MKGTEMKKNATGTGTVYEWLVDGAKALFGAAVFGLLAFLICFLQGCESGGGGNPPVYNDQGVCVENCGNNGNVGALQPPCHVPTDPEIKEACMPKMYKGAICIGEGTGNPIPCVKGQTNCACYNLKRSTGKMALPPCTTDAECKPVPCEEWPPEICQGIPCILAGLWNCNQHSERGRAIFYMEYRDVIFYDNGDGYCRLHLPNIYHPDEENNDNDVYFKPGNDHFQRPPSGPAEIEFSLSEDGSHLFGSTGDLNTFSCYKVG